VDSCIFCKFVNHDLEAADAFYEDDNTLVMLDQDWVVKGHALVIWKAHHLNASDLTTSEFDQFSRIFRSAELTILKVTGKERSIVLKTGGLVSHFHFHIYPVDTNTSWQEIQDLFNKRVHYDAPRAEKEAFLNELRQQFVGA
jgi:diadenosine tetraphosphate (Ap4A) HIT family hydrolase